MSHDDKITVDDALISTDVDRLIRTISERGRLSIKELEGSIGIDGRTMDRWLKVLEDEGYITLEYGLRGTTIVWLGENDDNNSHLKDRVTREAAPRDGESVYDQPYYQSADVDPEEKLDEYIRTREREGDEEEDDGLRDSILKNMGPEEEPVEYTPKNDYTEDEAPYSEKNLEAAEEPEEAQEYAEELPSREEHEALPEADEEQEAPQYEEPEEGVEEPAEDGGFDEGNVEEAIDAVPEEAGYSDEEDSGEEVTGGNAFTLTKEEMVPERPSRLGGSSSQSMRDMVDGYMEQIAKEKAELQRLKQEKDKLYRERYLALESKMEADIVAVTERILDKEGRMMALKEKILEMPAKVDEVSRIQGIVNKMKSEGRSVLGKAKTSAKELSEEISRTEGELRSKMEESRSALAKEKSRVTDLERMNSSLESKIGSLRDSLEAAQMQLDEMNEGMKGLLTELEEATEMKVEISDMTTRVRNSMDMKETELAQLERQLDSITQIESWLNEYLDDYEKKMDEIERYVDGTEGDLEKMRKAAETEYIRKYLRELEEMTAGYEDGLTDASQKEKQIDKRIRETQSRMEELVSESKMMIKKLRSDTAGSEDFSSIGGAASENKQRMKSLLEEKGRERDRLKEDIQGAKSGRVKAVPRRAKPAKKASRKKPAKKKAKPVKKKKGRSKKKKKK